MTFSSLVTFAISLLIVFNPVSVCTVYLALTKNATAHEIKGIPVKFFIGVLIIMLISLWMGEFFLNLLGLSLPAFQVSGGILLLIIGISMILPKENSDGLQSEAKKDISTIAIVPLALPIGAGPAVMALLIESSDRYPYVQDRLLMSMIALIVALIGATMVRYAPNIAKKLGETGVQTMSRIVGLIIATIGSGMLTRALNTIYPALHSGLH